MPRSALFDRSDTLPLDWSGLYDEHAPRLHRIAARRVGREQARDIVQEIFIRAYRNRHSIDPSRPIGAWLSTIALRASTDALRRRSARPEEVAVDEADEDEPVLLGAGVDEDFENIVRREGIKAAFDSLPERQQRVFRHLALDGWTQEEVAAAEGMSTDAVKSLFARARHTFKETYQAFAERMGVFGGAAVGGAVWRVRSRLQRLHGLATEHVGAFGMAAATVTVVAIATVPTTRAVPTKAAEHPSDPSAAAMPTTPPVVPVQAEGGAPILAVAPSATSPATATATAPAPDNPPPSQATDPVGVTATMAAGTHGNGAWIHVRSDDRADRTESRTILVVEIDDCDENAVNGAGCSLVDVAADDD